MVGRISPTLTYGLIGGQDALPRGHDTQGDVRQLLLLLGRQRGVLVRHGGGGCERTGAESRAGGVPPPIRHVPPLRGSGTPVGLSPPALPISGGDALHKQAASRRLPSPRDGQGLVEDAGELPAILLPARPPPAQPSCGSEAPRGTGAEPGGPGMEIPQGRG